MATRVRARPTQRERADHTIEDLLRAARELFARGGYGATSLDAVCEAAHVTKGALYHHFTGKQHLFRAVYEREQERLNRVVADAYVACERPDSWDAVYVGAEAFLTAALDPDVQRISLLDAPGALGWEAMRELSTDCLGMMREGIRRAAASGEVTPHSEQALAHILYGALCETAMAVARADDQPAALQDSLAELRSLFTALAARGGSAA
ncbi:TetR/AcrR family transcriptional regulator [Streptomyces sp. A7024]|uniref:TetR/AcrR family transcriptional regulator n=1 Tax=Streptomyces coryli TaxID=1128680 RepID=A0A6G4U737_9ACTN|nr:TetR/AcrR family transcriptional regulator [Streptomyces coryli]NGN67994.1 TetR/AcrR family transcriptional regulator [Streptomyces coryli]